METPFKICDPIHGFIRFNTIEKQLVDSRPFQRLRYIRQMGMAYLVYPGATHSRFEHSLGVMHLADEIFTSIVDETVPLDPIYWRQIVRLAALCHDMGHLPFSHVAEKYLLPDGGHEKMTAAIIQSEELRAIWQQLGPTAEQDVMKLSVEDHGLEMTKWEQMLAQIITEDNFGADRIDYLLRDAYSTGASYGHFDYHQLIDTLRILQTPNPTIGIASSGMQSVESLWIARYMMYARVSHHSKVRLFCQHMGRLMQRHYQTVGFPETTDAYIRECDHTILNVIQDYADQGNYDAEALLFRKKPYQEVVWKGNVDTQALQKTFSSNIMIDFVEQKQGHRDFPVLTENKSHLTSKQASPFLTTIPLGVKGPLLYAHPNCKQKVHQWLEASGGSPA